MKIFKLKTKNEGNSIRWWSSLSIYLDWSSITNCRQIFHTVGSHTGGLTLRSKKGVVHLEQKSIILIHSADQTNKHKNIWAVLENSVGFHRWAPADRWAVHFSQSLHQAGISLHNYYMQIFIFRVCLHIHSYFKKCFINVFW
jgi:hypothetical protein